MPGPPPGRSSLRQSLTSLATSTVAAAAKSLPEGPPNARTALEELRHGAATFEALQDDLPRGVDAVLKGLRAKVQELEEIVDRAARWEKKCPQGGKLLWVQITPGAGEEEPAEWGLGQLNVTKDCLFFEANEVPSWSIGPVMWKDVVRVEMLQGTQKEMGDLAKEVMNGRPSDIRICWGNAAAPSVLRLQLSIQDIAWVEKSLPEGASVLMVDKAEEDRKNEEAAAKAAAEAKPPKTPIRKTMHELSFNRSTTAALSASFYDTAKAMTSAGAPRLKDSAYSITLTKPSMDDIFDFIVKQPWLIEQFIKERLNGTDVESTAWAESKRMPGTHMSRTKWKTPLPDNVPADITRLVELPENLDLTFMSRVHQSDQEIILSQRGHCQNVHHGENFIVQVTFTFRPQDDGNVIFDAFVEVQWIIELPSSHASLSAFIDILTRQQTEAFAKAFSDALGGGDSSAPDSMKIGAVTSAIPETEVVETLPPLLIEEAVHLTGLFTKWATDFPAGRMEPVPSKRPGFALMRFCIRLTSESLSFAIVTAKRGWAWRLFPRDAVAIRIGFIKSHVSKEGVLTASDPDAVAIGLGNLSVGHGLNFHVLEKDGAVVTIWVEIPVTTGGGGGDYGGYGGGSSVEIDTNTAEGAKVWYTREDTGLHHTAGDGMDLSKYRKWLPPRKD